MSIAGLREAFNAVAVPRYTATTALLSMERRAGQEWSRLTFRGVGADGIEFEVSSDLFPASGDVTEAAQVVARKLVEGK